MVELNVDTQQDEAATKKSIEAAKPTQSLERKHKFVFNKCCFCVPLRTGCLILAYLFLVGTIVVGIYSILGIITLVNVIPHLSHEYLNVFIAVLVLNAVALVLALVAIPFNVLLIIGLHKERRSFVKLFVRFQLAYIIVYVLQFIVLIIIGYAKPVGLVTSLISLTLNIYYVLVMRSQYLKMGATANSAPDRQLYSDGHLVITP